MKNVMIFCTVLYGLAVFPPAGAGAQWLEDGPLPGERMNVALLRMEVPEGFYPSERAALETDFMNALQRTGKFNLVSRDEMEQIVNELKFQTSDMVDEERAVQLGKLLGVDHFVTFSVRSVHGIYQVTAKLISLETGKVVRIVVERCEDTKFEFLTALCNEIAYNLAGIEERKGSVRIESTPAEAEVFLFGISRGFSPIVLPLAPGPYLITVKKSGYKWKRKTLRIAPKQESLWEVQLNRKRERKLRDYINGEGVWK